MDKLKSKYEYLCNTPSDINEHLETLYKYAKECDSVFETGVRGVVSSYSFVYGLMCSDRNNQKKILLNDLTECNINELLSITKTLNIDVQYIWESNLKINFKENEMYDLTFIDTWHVYGQLIRELNKFSKNTNKYIILHDTTVDAIYGEAKRFDGYGNEYVNSGNISELSKITDIPENEILNGLWPAVEEFLSQNPEWILKERFTNNNGLTILQHI